VAQDDARDGDQQLTIGELVFLIDDELERVLTTNGGLRIGYRASALGGEFAVEFAEAHEGCSC
jgi:hypothetical protein